MKKIDVKICMGTTCFIMCNSELEEIEKEIEPETAQYVRISGTSCLNLCKNVEYRIIPCATVDGEIIENVDKTKLLAAIKNAVAGKFMVEIKNGK